VCEHYGIDTRKIELLTGSLEPITSSVGGFCCGENGIIYHQRLNSSGYVYSCSLPPLLAAVSITALDIIDAQPQLLERLHKNTATLYKGLSSMANIDLTSQPSSPVIHLRLRSGPSDRLQNETILQNIVDEALNGGVFLTRARYVHNYEHNLPSPSIRIAVSGALTDQHLQTAVAVIRSAVDKVLGNQAEIPSEKGKIAQTTTASPSPSPTSSPSTPAAQSPASKKKKKTKST